MTTGPGSKERSPRALREALGFDVRRWARVLNVNPQTIERWDSGVTAPVGLAADILRALDQCLNDGVPADTIRGSISLGLGAFIATELLAQKKKTR